MVRVWAVQAYKGGTRYNQEDPGYGALHMTKSIKPQPSPLRSHASVRIDYHLSPNHQVCQCPWLAFISAGTEKHPLP